MKKIVYGMVVSFCFCLPVLASELSPVWTGDVGIQKSSYQYDEPGMMSLAGDRVSLMGTLTATFEKTFITGEFRSSHANLQYESNGTGTMNSVPDTITEARAVVGTIFVASPKVTLFPYVGIGFRWLDNGVAGMTTSTGAISYRRNSQYTYVPIGLSARIAVGESGWTVVPTAETTVLFRGTQTSYLSEVSPLNDAVNSQTIGSGYRMSLAIEKDHWSLSGWFRSWDIANSDVVYVGYGFYGMEPRNKTKEVGLGVKYKFY